LVKRLDVSVLVASVLTLAVASSLAGRRIRTRR